MAQNKERTPLVTLADLLGNLLPRQSNSNIYISNCSADSRQVAPGGVFIACVGSKQDGRLFIDEAVANGAIVIIYENSIPLTSQMQHSLIQARNQGVETFALENCKDKLGFLAANFYFSPTSQMTTVAITGTNGKTSCVNIIAKALDYNNKSVGSIGTLGWGKLPNLNNTTLTTPDALKFQYYCASLRDQGVESLIFEASSHALSQSRLSGTYIDIAIFTNLTRDHLDYHNNFVNYGNAKLELFVNHNINTAIINLDDAFADTIISKLASKVKKIGVSQGFKVVDYQLCYAEDIIVSMDGVSFVAHTPWGKSLIKSSLQGKFQVTNLLLALAALVEQGLSFQQACNSLGKVKCIPGRAQFFGGGEKPIVIVDYAHTPDALQAILEHARLISKGKVWCVFGCGGDRDVGKRSQMGKVAEKLSDMLVLTNDNPRDECQESIVNDILSGVSCNWSINIEYNRADAIDYAITNSKMGDVVVVAGKGHEHVQIIQGEYLYHSDINYVTNRLNAWVLKSSSV